MTLRRIGGHALAAALAACGLCACEAPPPKLDGLQIAIVPASPGPEDELVATVVAHSGGWGADDFTYIYRWSRNEEELPEHTTRTLSSDLTTAGEAWSVQVTPQLTWDEELLVGPSAAADVSIEDEAS